MPDPRWRQYERQIEKYIRDHAGPSASIHYDVRRPGIFSGESRQIDIWVEDIFAGFVKDGTAAVDCKYFSKKVDVRGVEQFIGLIEDVGADFGVMFTTVGYSSAAKSRVQRGIRLHVMAALDLAIVSDDRVFSVFPAADEGAYSGEFYDYEPYGGTRGIIAYEGPMILGETAEPGDAEDLASGPDIDWATPNQQRQTARVVLRHYDGEEPDNERVDQFLDELGFLFEPGQRWVLPESELHARIG